MFVLTLLVLGLVIGSFLNVCIYRLPRGESIVFPPSRCPACGHRLAVLDLVPVLSYLFLGGRCRYCRQKISAQYPLVELGTAGLFVLVFQVRGPSPGAVGGLVLACALLVVTLTDVRHYRIPNQAVAFLAVSGPLVNLWSGELPWWQVAAGAAVGGGLLGALALLRRGGMGEGDIKLAAATGLFLGPGRQLLAIFLAAVLGSLFWGVLILLGRKTRRDPLPFAPFLGVGTLVAYLWGQALWSLYLSWAGLA